MARRPGALYSVRGEQEIQRNALAVEIAEAALFRPFPSHREATDARLQKGWDTEMALYMDIHHHVEGLTADAVKGAHEADVATQEQYGVRYLEYWFNEATGQVFCLVEAPSAEAAAEVHRKAHGLVADEIIEVRQGSASE